MIGIGYMAKRVAQRPEWLQVPGVKDIFSVSSCISNDFMDYIEFWRHNGYWFFDHPNIIRELSQENGIDLSRLTFFYYEAYEREFDEQRKQWLDFQPSDLTINIIPPTKKEFQGYDVVTFSTETNPGCSPLSCNHLATEMKTNSHCLLESFEETKQSLQSGKFDNSEPGPFRIIAVYTVDPNG